MDKNYKHATDMEERLRRASDTDRSRWAAVCKAAKGVGVTVQDAASVLGSAKRRDDAVCSPAAFGAGKHENTLHPRVVETDACAAVAKWREKHRAMAGHWPQPTCAICGCSIRYYDQMVPGDQVTSDGTPDQLFCLHCADALARERRHSRDPVEDFNPTRWAVLSAVVILVIITLNVI